MSKGAMGMVMLVIASVVIAIVAHWRIRDQVVAALCTAVVTSLGCQVVVTIDLGHLDPFFLIAIVTSGLLAFAVALLVGIPFRLARRAGASRPAARR